MSTRSTQKKLACPKSLTNLHQNRAKFILCRSNAKTFNSHLLAKIIQLERNAVANSLYSRKEITELNPAPAEIHEDEEGICEVLSLTTFHVVPEEIHACHCMKRSYRVLVKFKCRNQKQSLMYKHKNVSFKSQELKNLRFLERPFSECMPHQNQQLAYICRQLKSVEKIHSN